MLTIIVVVERIFWTEMAFLSIWFGSSSNPCVRDMASDLNLLRRCVCLALKIICITCWLQKKLALEGTSTLSSMSVMFITKWMS